MTSEVVRSAEMTSKYHQSHELLLIDDSCGPSRLYGDETKLATLLLVAAVAGITVAPKPKLRMVGNDGKANDVGVAQAARNQEMNCLIVKSSKYSLLDFTGKDYEESRWPPFLKTDLKMDYHGQFIIYKYTETQKQIV